MNIGRGGDLTERERDMDRDTQAEKVAKQMKNVEKRGAY